MDHHEMSETVKADILQAALPDLAFEGFTDAVIDKAAQSAAIEPAETALAFPRGGIDLAIYFVRHGVIEMREKLEMIDIESMKIRNRIKTAVQTRLEVDTDNKEIARRAFNMLALPGNAKDASICLAHTVDVMWRSTGDTSTDFNFYTKRATLAAVYSATRLFWLNDDSPDAENSWAFLDRRIDNVMQIEKGKAKFRDLQNKLGNPLETLAQFRYR
jgi:ubiquinone biosynthesis protein COQ9